MFRHRFESASAVSDGTASGRRFAAGELLEYPAVPSFSCFEKEGFAEPEPFREPPITARLPRGREATGPSCADRPEDGQAGPPLDVTSQLTRLEMDLEVERAASNYYLRELNVLRDHRSGGPMTESAVVNRLKQCQDQVLQKTKLAEKAHVELQSTKRHCRSLEHELESKVSELTDALNQKEKDWRAAVEEIDRLEERWKAQMDDQENSLPKQKERLEAERRAAEKLATEAKELNDALSQREVELTGRRRSVENREAAVEALRREWEEKKGRLEEEREQLAEELRRLHQQTTKLAKREKSSAKQEAALQVKEQQLKREQHHFELEQSKLREAFEAEKSQFAERLEEFQRTSERCNQQEAVLVEKTDQLEKGKSELQVGQQELRNDRQELESEKAVLSRRLENLRRAEDDLTKSNDQLKKLRMALEQEQGRLEEQRTKFAVQQRQFDEELQKLEEGRLALQHQADQLTDREEILNHEIQQLRHSQSARREAARFEVTPHLAIHIPPDGPSLSPTNQRGEAQEEGIDWREKYLMATKVQETLKQQLEAAQAMSMHLAARPKQPSGKPPVARKKTQSAETADEDHGGARPAAAARALSRRGPEIIDSLVQLESSSNAAKTHCSPELPDAVEVLVEPARTGGSGGPKRTSGGRRRKVSTSPEFPSSPTFPGESPAKRRRQLTADSPEHRSVDAERKTPQAPPGAGTRKTTRPRSRRPGDE